MRSRNFYEILKNYRTHIITGIASFLLGASIFSSCGKYSSASKEPELPPYPVTFQVYKIPNYNDNNPVARAIMSDKRTELLSADNKDGTSYTNLRILEEKEIKSKKTDWALKRLGLEEKIKETEIQKSK